MATPTTKHVDALMIKRLGAEALAAQLAGMTPEEQRQFWEERTRALRERQAAKRAAPHAYGRPWRYSIVDIRAAAQLNPANS